MIVNLLYLYSILSALSLVICYEKHYDNYSVIRVIPENVNQVKFLQNWAQNLTDEHLKGIDFWRYPSHLHTNVDVMVAPNLKPEIFQLFTSINMKPDVLIENVENRIIQEKYYNQLIESKIDVEIPENFGNFSDLGNKDMKKVPINTTRAGNEFPESFQSIENINSFLEQLRKKDPNYMTIESIGKSVEGRDIKYIKIGSSSNKPIAWIDGGTHAREWLAISTALYIAYQLADARYKCFVQNSTDCPQDVKQLLNLYDWQVLPVLNPDGYTYSRSGDRMWRKNRAKAKRAGSRCAGVDLNRNYDIDFGGKGTSRDQCQETYDGGRAFSEPETAGQAKHLMSYKQNGVNRIKYLLSLHTYAQLILLPWSYKAAKPPEYKDLESASIEGNKALYAAEHQVYGIGASAIILYPAAASSTDWTFLNSGPNIKHSYTIELRDKGQYGFIAPQSAIKPTGREIFACVKAMAQHIYTKELRG